MPTPLSCRHDEWNRHSCLYELLSPQTAALDGRSSDHPFSGGGCEKRDRTSACNSRSLCLKQDARHLPDEIFLTEALCPNLQTLRRNIFFDPFEPFDGEGEFLLGR